MDKKNSLINLGCRLNIYEGEIIKNHLNDNNIGDVFTQLYKFLKLYNNNYRPIYHLENYFYYLLSVIHEYE